MYVLVAESQKMLHKKPTLICTRMGKNCQAKTPDKKIMKTCLLLFQRKTYQIFPALG